MIHNLGGLFLCFAVLLVFFFPLLFCSSLLTQPVVLPSFLLSLLPFCFSPSSLLSPFSPSLHHLFFLSLFSIFALSLPSCLLFLHLLFSISLRPLSSLPIFIVSVCSRVRTTNLLSVPRTAPYSEASGNRKGYVLFYFFIAAREGQSTWPVLLSYCNAETRTRDWRGDASKSISVIQGSSDSASVVIEAEKIWSLMPRCRDTDICLSCYFCSSCQE